MGKQTNIITETTGEELLQVSTRSKQSKKLTNREKEHLTTMVRKKISEYQEVLDNLANEGTENLAFIIKEQIKELKEIEYKLN